MKIVVTGGLGYIGSVLVPLLRARGDAVEVIDTDWFNAARVGGPSGEIVAEPDFRNAGPEQFYGVDAVIHLAGLSNDPLGSLEPEFTHALNNFEAVKFAQRAKQAGVKVFVFASSCSVYGNSDAEELDESSLAVPLTAYSKAKLDAEEALLSMASEDFRVSILRGATAFGWAACPRTDLLLNELCAVAACEQPIELHSDGTSWRPFMPVDDFARAFVAAVSSPPTTNHVLPVWNIAPPGMQMTVADAARRAAAVANAPSPVFGTGAGRDQRSYRVNGSRFLNAYPDFEYSTDFDRVIAETVAGFASVQTLTDDMNTGRFVRLKNVDRRALRRLSLAS